MIKQHEDDRSGSSTAQHRTNLICNIFYKRWILKVFRRIRATTMENVEAGMKISRFNYPVYVWADMSSSLCT